MTEKEMLEEFVELVSIDAASGKEADVAQIVKAKLAAMGFQVSEDGAGSSFGGDCGNVLAVREGELKGAVLLCSHLDRVPQGLGIKPVEKEGIVYSDGTTILAADDLSGVCTILAGVRKVLAAKIPLPRLEVLFTVGEEAGLLGAKFMDMSLLQSKIGYVFDSPGSVGRFINAAPGSYSLQGELTGLAAHAGNEPEKGLDAAKAMCEILATIKSGRLDEESTANFPVLSTGSTVTNVVCDYALFKGETRSRNKEKLEAYVAYFENHCKEIAAKHGVQLKLTDKEKMLPFFISEEEQVLRLAKAACEKLKINWVINAGGGGMDANIFNAKGMNCIGVATGYTRNHTKQEQLVLADFYKAAHLAEELIRGYALECPGK